ncbi:MAG TPA: hypothetical protein VKB51_17380 [bacterium]|nr:hypothetical protein [bacterium]
MELDLNLERDAELDLYCDVVVRYLLVESALGECELQRRLGAALDSADAVRMAAVLRDFEALPEDLRTRIMDGDPTLPTLMEGRQGAKEDEPIAAARPASA